MIQFNKKFNNTCCFIIILVVLMYSIGIKTKSPARIALVRGFLLINAVP